MQVLVEQRNPKYPAQVKGRNRQGCPVFFEGDIDELKGLLASLVCILISAVVNRLTLHLNLETCRVAKCSPATADVAEQAFGRAGRLSMVGLYTAFSFICCVSYVVASADAVRGLCSLLLQEGQPLPPAPMVTLLCWAGLLLPTTLVRSLRSVATVSLQSCDTPI